ncbi:hypothetical protein MP638_006141 [Amoeboaphelidium occidentale]|nr:hypothetical protein MP638_006141 [Amoeboaphelidium occidentale]
MKQLQRLRTVQDFPECLEHGEPIEVTLFDPKPSILKNYEIVDKRVIRVNGMNVHAPSKTISTRLTSFDTYGGVVAHSSGEGIKVLFGSTGKVVDLRGHFVETSSLKLFPSAKVLLSGGMDMMLKIWDLGDGSCEREMKGHTSTITALGILGRGKNVVSGSKDGTLRQWNCAEGKCVATLKVSAPVSCIDVFHDLIGVSFGNTIKIVKSVSSENGSFEELQSLDVQRVSCICFISDNTIVSGSEDGIIQIHNLKDASKSVEPMKRNDLAINSMFKVADNSVIVAAQDSCFKLNIETLCVTDEYLCNNSCVLKVTEHNKITYASTKDGIFLF